MYNLFVTAKEGAWDNLFYEYDRSRFLEYTNDKIANTFKILTERRIAQLISLPCLFTYEGTEKNVRIGRLTSIKERGRMLLIEYVFYPDIQEIPFSSIETIAPLLDIRDWEMNRTHWAVKDENLLERLHAASLIDSSHIESQTTPEDISSLPDLQTHYSRITTVKGFIEKVLSGDKREGWEVFYRGHSDRKKYKLEPSLFRKDKDGNYLHLENEHILYRELIVSNSSEFYSDEYTLDRLVKMQHYSLPTRLLDITSNPLMALYFACKSNMTKEGEVIIFSMLREQVKYFDSDTASCIANLARLPKRNKDTINFEENGFNEQAEIKHLTHFIKGEKPYFEPNIVPEDLHRILCVKGKKSNDRISSQSGAFLLFGLDSVLNEDGTPEFEVKRITVTNKESILKDLDLLNINESTVFPHIENSAKYVAKKYQFNKSLQQTAKSSD